MSTLPQRFYTIQEYAEIEANSTIKFEYHEGEIVAMVGSTPNHSRVTMNISFELMKQLRARGCEVFNSDMRIKVPSPPCYTYPDISVVCGQAEFEKIYHLETLTNPTILVEVLSPSTRRLDLGKKLKDYLTLTSLKEYLIVEPDKAKAILYEKQANNNWAEQVVIGLDSQITLLAISCVLEMKDIYFNIKL